MSDLTVAAIQMDSIVGDVEANLSRAGALVERAAREGAQLIVLPELFNTGYAYADQNFSLLETLDGQTGTWIVGMARRLGIHLVGTFPAKMPGGAYITAMLAAPDGRQWTYRKVHVAMWENCYYDRGSDPVIADTELGRVGLLICWDQVFADLARAYQGQVDLLCIPSSPPTWVGSVEDGQGTVLGRLDSLRTLGTTLDGEAWFDRAQILQALSAGVPVVYAARSGTFYSPLPYGSSFLQLLGIRGAMRVLRAVGARFWLRCPMMGRSCIVNGEGRRIAQTGVEGEAVLVAKIRPEAPAHETLPLLPKGRSLVPGIPRAQFLFDDSMIVAGRWYRRRHAPKA